MPSDKKKNMAFRILDLPENVRMRIYGFVLGFKVIHVDAKPQFEGNSEIDSGFTYRICDSSFAFHSISKDDEVEVDEMIYKCTNTLANVSMLRTKLPSNHLTLVF